MKTSDIPIKEFEFSDREYKQLRELVLFSHKNTELIKIKTFAYCMFYNVYNKEVGRGHVIWLEPDNLDLFLAMLKEVSTTHNAPSFAKDFEKEVLEVLQV